jgi:hypothetical protein
MSAFFSRLYVASQSPLSELLGAVAHVLDGDEDMSTITTSVASTYFSTSDDYDCAAVQRDATDFIRYPYSVEIEAAPNVGLDRYLEEVALIMRTLHTLGSNVVASCDWEDLLPGSGKLGAAFAG